MKKSIPASICHIANIFNSDKNVSGICNICSISVRFFIYNDVDQVAKESGQDV